MSLTLLRVCVAAQKSIKLLLQLNFMGPPPQYLIERKLIRKFMKTFLPRNPLIPEYYFTGLFECWRTYGASSPRCKQQQMKFDFAHQQTKIYQKALSGMRLTQLVTSELKKPLYPFILKGRHKKDLFTNVLKML